MCDSVYTFGQRGGYYFECPSEWQYAHLPKGLAKLFDEKLVASAYCTVLGAEESYLISYKGKDGMQHIQSENIPETLKEWLYEKSADGELSRQLEKLKITLGPANESYFASDGTSYKWLNLPTGFSYALQTRRKPVGGWTSDPRIVSLGFNGSYVYITEGNGGAWDVSKYRSLDASIDVIKKKEGGLGLIKDIVLNPYRLQNYILQSTNGILLADGAAPYISGAISSIGNAVKSDTGLRESRELETKIEVARQQAESERLQSRLDQAIGAFSNLNISGFGGSGRPNGSSFGFDASTFWQPIIDAATMPIL